MERVNLNALEEFIAAPCPSDHLAEKDGVLYIPIEVMEYKLDRLHSDFGIMWSTRNYKSVIIPNDDKSDFLVSASLELVLSGQGYYRFLVGATTFMASAYEGNTYLDAIAKSLCTVNAASDIGNWFGRQLSRQEKHVDGEGKMRSRRAEAKLLIPDAKIRTLYAKAVAANDIDTVNRYERIYKFD